jgi:hypothetical protein
MTLDLAEKRALAFALYQGIGFSRAVRALKLSGL